VKSFIIGQSDKEFYTSHSGLALVGLCVNKFCSLPSKAREGFPLSPGSNGIGLASCCRCTQWSRGKLKSFDLSMLKMRDPVFGSKWTFEASKGTFAHFELTDSGIKNALMLARCLSILQTCQGSYMCKSR
jgi:hypothetical protein